MKLKFASPVFLLITFFLSACSNNPFLPPTSTPTPTFTPLPTSTSTPTLVPTLTLEQKYKEDMMQVLEMVDEHEKIIDMAWRLLLDTEINKNLSIIALTQSPPTYRDLAQHVFYVAQHYKGDFFTVTTYPDIQDELKNLTIINKRSQLSYYDMQVALGGIDVPAEITKPHQDFVDCINTHYNAQSFMAKMFSGELPSAADFEENKKDGCANYDLALEKIIEYLVTD